jgi:maltose alpha-D-glucosyltransferase/alpha-amylase
LLTETLAERRRKHNCLRDVAGMIRSFHYAAFTALLETAVVRPEDRPFAAPWADTWYRWVSGAFLRKYLDVTAGAAFLPAPDDLEVILDAQVLQKAFIELRGELDLCAETTSIPLSSIVERAGL